MQLRDYQQNMKDRLYDTWTKVSSVMLQMPTGTGKTHLMAAVIRENMEVGVLFVAHRIELIEQISKTLDKFFAVGRKLRDSGKFPAEPVIKFEVSEPTDEQRATRRRHESDIEDKAGEQLTMPNF